MLKRCVDLAWHGEIAERHPWHSLFQRRADTLLTVAELAGASEDREFTETPVLIAKRAGGFLSGTIRPESVSLALLRMADLGVIMELELSRHLVVGRIADYHRLVEIAMD